MRDEKCSDNTTKGSAATGIYAKCCRMTFWLAFGAFLSVFKVSQKVDLPADMLPFRVREITDSETCYSFNHVYFRRFQ